jgi:hypothetical protein
MFGSFSLIRYMMNPYSVIFEFNNDKIIYVCKLNNKIVFLDYFFGLNIFYEIQYFLILHNYVFDFDDKKIEILFYKKRTFHNFQNMLYIMINNKNLTYI